MLKWMIPEPIVHPFAAYKMKIFFERSMAIFNSKMAIFRPKMAILGAFWHLRQCIANIRTFKYIRIISHEYIHIHRYSAKIWTMNIFGYSFVNSKVDEYIQIFVRRRTLYSLHKVSGLTRLNWQNMVWYDCDECEMWTEGKS